MENWEKEIITSNIPKLLEYTNCCEPLLAILESKGIFSHCDRLSINSNTDDTSKTRALYDKLVTRTNGFNVLLTGLSETKQSGALNILTGGNPGSVVGDGLFKYDKNDLLGIGSFGTKVFRGDFGGKQVAVKRISCKNIDYEQTLHEIKQQIVLDPHENVVRTFAVEKALGPKRYILAAKQLGEMNLNRWLGYGKSSLKLTPSNLLSQVTGGINYLHRNNISHRSITPNNILIYDGGNHGTPTAKVCDGGTSNITSIKGDACILVALGKTEVEGWMSPEILNDIKEFGGLVIVPQIKFTHEADVFSLGCIFYYVLTEGDHLFGNPIERNKNIMQNKHRYDFKKLRKYQNQWVELIDNMATYEPMNRITTEQILGNPLFSRETQYLCVNNNYTNESSQLNGKRQRKSFQRKGKTAPKGRQETLINLPASEPANANMTENRNLEGSASRTGRRNLVGNRTGNTILSGNSNFVRNSNMVGNAIIAENATTAANSDIGRSANVAENTDMSQKTTRAKINVPQSDWLHTLVRVIPTLCCVVLITVFLSKQSKS